MKISVRWLNEYLEPGTVTAEEAERVLTFAGFPIESAEKLPSGDVCLDVEVTSNRGDVLSHIGVAREVAALTGRGLKLPAAGKCFNWFGEGDVGTAAASVGSQDVGMAVAIENQVGGFCPLFTARVIRGVKVGPSPKWLVSALEGIGLRSINNVVDITNFVAMEYGQPSHVFDLAKIAHHADGKARVAVRKAIKGEKLELLDGKTITLAGDELVVADWPDAAAGGRAISLAGVMGGAETGVTERTVDVLLEAATWAPVEVRRAARRFGIRTDASYRFERTVDPRTIDVAGKRLAALICKLAGGRLLTGVIHAGAALPETSAVKLRPSRVRSMLGSEVSTAEIQRMLEAHEISVRPEASSVQAGEPALTCMIPAHRPDLYREIDLIEEIARTNGLDKLPVHEMVASRVTSPQASEKAGEVLGQVLTGLGFFEAITFTFTSPKAAKAFVPAGHEVMEVCDDRRVADPVLRPSALPSLLACRKANQDRGVKAEGEAGIRLFEYSSAFMQKPAEKKGERGAHVEKYTVALLADCSSPLGGKAMEQKQMGVRVMRGAIEAAARALGGEAVGVEIRPLEQAPVAALEAGACAEVVINGEVAGVMGLVSASVQSAAGLEMPVVMAELSVPVLVKLYPPKAVVTALPAFPAIERDLSLVVGEGVRWAQVEELIAKMRVDLLESWAFVGTYRGAQAGAGKKSVTLRMRFRDGQRTLKHEEVSPQVEGIIAEAAKALGATVRTV